MQIPIRTSPLTKVSSVEQTLFEPFRRRFRFQTQLMGAFALVALLLVDRRNLRRQLLCGRAAPARDRAAGMALGASPSRVLREVLGQGMRLTAHRDCDRPDRGGPRSRRCSEASWSASAPPIQLDARGCRAPAGVRSRDCLLHPGSKSHADRSGARLTSGMTRPGTILSFRISRRQEEDRLPGEAGVREIPYTEAEVHPGTSRLLVCFCPTEAAESLRHASADDLLHNRETASRFEIRQGAVTCSGQAREAICNRFKT